MRRRSGPRIRSITAAIALLLCAPAPQLALAQADADAKAEAEESEDEEDQAAKHFAKGRELYSQGKYKEAIEWLLKAFTLRPAPPILLNIGRTYEKLEDKKKALEYYEQFLQKARMVDPNRKSVETMVKRLRRETGAAASDAAAGADTPDAKKTADDGLTVKVDNQMIHTPVDAAKVRKPILVQAELPTGAKADGVWLFYRRAGQRNFRKLAMAIQGDAYVVEIPGKHVTSTSLQYYIEARKSGKRRALARTGGRSTPHIVVIEGGRAPITNGDTIDIRSPYRTWLWVSVGGAAALIGGGIAMAVMANDRSSAVEVAAGKGEQFDLRARDWESEGQTFATASKVFIGLGIVAAGAAGYLWYRDRKYVKTKRAELMAGSTQRLRFAPWASSDGGGFVGRIDF